MKRIEDLLPSHTKRSEDSVRLQQFSTPIGIGEAMARAAQLVSSDLVLEPSAGTGLLAIHAELRGAMLILNELAETRHGILKGLFPSTPLSGFNAEQIDDFLPEEIAPTVVLMNPPFSVTPNVDGASLLAGLRHVSSALARLSPKGRLVALLSDRFDPCSPRFAESFARLCETGRLVFHATVDGALYQRHGTTTATRILVFDKEPAGASVLPASSGHATELATLFRLVDEGVPSRLAAPAPIVPGLPKAAPVAKPAARTAPSPFTASSAPAEPVSGEPVAYQRKSTEDAAGTRSEAGEIPHLAPSGGQQRHPQCPDPRKAGSRLGRLGAASGARLSTSRATGPIRTCCGWSTGGRCFAGPRGRSARSSARRRGTPFG